MNWVTTLVICLSAMAITGCPEDSCKGNSDCKNGYSCTEGGKCVKADPLRIVDSALPDAVVGQVYNFEMTATGGIEPYTWVVETDLGWISMGASTGSISGNPFGIETGADLKVTVTDSSYGAGEEASRDFLLNVSYCGDSQASPCYGHGSCTSGVCECDVGYIGNQCEGCDDGYHESQGECVIDAVCDANSCSGHGECDDSSGVIECTCDEGYRGDSCSECAAGFHDEQGVCVKDEVCLENSCDGHGDCEDASGVVVCSCDAGYEGDHCESCADGYHRDGGECLANDVCEANSCSGHGTCDDSTGVVICECDEGYDGEQCETCAGGYHDDGGVCVKDQVCLPNSCSGHGTCEDGTGVVVCDCDEWYRGDYCEIPELDTLTQNDSQPEDYYGSSVAISGDYAIVGAKNEDGGPGDPIGAAGAVYVYLLTGVNEWDGGIKLTATDPQSWDRFGSSVSISGDYAIVGADSEDGGPGDPADGAGAAYVFMLTGINEWDEGTKITAPDAQEGDRFGSSVSISGDYAIVGASMENGGSGDPITDAGVAYVFRTTGANDWLYLTKLVAPDAQASDMFGVSVGISGDYTIVGAWNEDGGPGDPISEAGAAYVFYKNAAIDWDDGYKLTASDAQASDRFGQAVAMSGNYAIVGAKNEDGGPGDPISDSGAAYVFRRTGQNVWEFSAKLTSPDAQSWDEFGSSVAMSGDFAIVGSHYERGGPGDPFDDSGAAYIFTRTGQDTWEYTTKLMSPNPQDNGWFGTDVSASGGYFLVGADYEDGAGAAYVFYP